jgi:hypothetical protein
MESKNFDQDCVRLSDNLVTDENVCSMNVCSMNVCSMNVCSMNEESQQNQVQSNNFTHILENSKKPIEEVENLFKKTKFKDIAKDKDKDKHKYKHKKNKNNLDLINYNKNPNIELKEFKILNTLGQKDIFHKPNHFLTFGKRATGKSHLMKEISLLLKNENIVENIIFFSHQSSINEYASILQPNQFHKIKNELNPSDIDKILEYQSKPDAKSLLVVFDDVIYSKTFIQNSYQKLMINARNYNIYTITITQYPLELPYEITKDIFDLPFEIINNQDNQDYQYYHDNQYYNINSTINTTNVISTISLLSYNVC